MGDDATLWLINRTVGIVSWQIKNGAWNIYSLHYDFKRQTTNEYATTDHNGNILFNMYFNDGMYKFDTRQKKIEHVFENKNFSCILFGRKKFFSLSGNMIFRFDSVSLHKDSVVIPSLKNRNNIAALLMEDDFGRLWIGSNTNGLFCFDFDNKKLIQYRYDISLRQTLTSDLIKTLTEDRSGNLWIGTDDGGVCKLDLKPPTFNLFPHNENEFPFVTNYFTKCFFEDARKRVWFGTLSGLNIYDPVTGNLKHFEHHEKDENNLPAESVSVIFRDRDGKIWIADNIGISVFDEEKKRFYPIPLLLPHQIDSTSNFVYQIIQLKNGDLFAATSRQLLLIKKDSRNKYTAISEFKGGNISTGTVTGIIETDDGLWIGTALGGLLHASFLKDSLVIKELFFPGIDLRSLHRDDIDPSVLWIASGKGLIKFNMKTKKFELFGENKGIANSYVYGILEDEMHHLWMSTNGGITMFDKNSKQFANYTWKDGLQSNEFNTGAFYKGASGYFYFGGVKGFNYFKPAEVIARKNTTIPGIALTEILINDKTYPQDPVFNADRRLRVKYFENDLSFKLSVLDFTLPQANKIQYKLDNWDNDWVTTYNKQGDYRNLPPGSYIFKAKACNSSGIWSKEKNVSIIITPPFWKTWWFYSLGILVVAVTIIFVTRYISQNKLKETIRHLEKQQAIEAERSRISKDMHDEIGSGLTRIALMTELMHTQKQLDEKTKQDVNEIAGSTRQLVETMSEIIWAMNPKNDKLSNLLSYLREQTRLYFEPLNVNYKISFPDTVPDLQLSNEQRRNLFLVTKEALNNALKHSGATDIELSAVIINNTLQFSTKDNGKGINMTVIRSGANGLNNMKQRMEDIQGGIKWESNNGIGTTIDYWITI